DTETDQDHSTETITLSGSPTSWSGTVTQHDDDNMTLTDHGEDDVQSTVNGSTTDDDEHWNGTASGPVHSTLQVSVSGDDSDQVSLQNLDWTVTATITDDSTDTDTETVTGADPSDETLTLT